MSVDPDGYTFEVQRFQKEQELMDRKTILITGASSGIGKSTVDYFSRNGWNVAATMRTPEKSNDLAKLDHVKIYKLDVGDEASISAAIDSAIKDFGGIDVLLNNAGYGAVGVFEAATTEQIRKQFDTNVFGVMNVIRHILPHFRKRRAGTIMTVSSVGGQITFPLYSLYHGTKWAVEGFSESLHYELKSFGIKVKLIEPGAIKTDFYSRSQELFQMEGLTDYDHYLKVAFENTQRFGDTAPGPEVVAKKIFQAASDNSWRLRYSIGSHAPFLLVLRRIIPNKAFFGIVKSIVEKGLQG